MSVLNVSVTMANSRGLGLWDFLAPTTRQVGASLCDLKLELETEARGTPSSLLALRDRVLVQCFVTCFILFYFILVQQTAGTQLVPHCKCCSNPEGYRSPPACYSDYECNGC